MKADEIDRQYCRWSNKLHLWVTERTGRPLSVQYFPLWQNEPKMRLFKGEPQYQISGSGMPQLLPPSGVYVDFPLPRPQDNPTQQILDETFKQLCLAAARLLEIDLGKPKLVSKEWIGSEAIGSDGTEGD